MLSPPDADLVRRDPALPGLAVLLDPEAFVAALGSVLPKADGATAQITYIRYKPGTSCLVSFRLEEAGSAYDLHAKAYPLGAEDKLRKAHAASSDGGRAEADRLVWEDRGITVALFPHDRDLPALARMGNPETRRGLLRKLFPDRPGLWEGTPKTLRYKPERRYVAQVSDPGGAAVTVKIYTEAGYSAAQLATRTIASPRPLKLARLMGRSVRHRILAFQWIQGRPLREALAMTGYDPGVMERVGQALAVLHAQDPGGLPSLGRGTEADYLWASARALGFVCPHLSDRAHRLAARLAADLAGESLAGRPTHGDFHPDQVLLCDRRVAILDLDEAIRGDPASDLGLFLAHLDRDTIEGLLPPGRVDPFRESLLQGYREVTSAPSPSRVDRYHAAGLLRRSLYPFRRHEAGWPDRTEAMLDRAECILRALPATRSGRTGAGSPEDGMRLVGQEP